MFTLMPVAAFAADAELDDTYIKNYKECLKIHSTFLKKHTQPNAHF